MTTVVLFHHAQGLTDGVLWFADELRAAGHQVSVPDLYRGATFATLQEGVAHAEDIGFGELVARGVAAVDETPAAVAGFSLGVLPAQKIAQTRPGVRGAVLYHAAVPSTQFDGPWPAEVALQIHLTAEDPWAEEDRQAAEQLAAEAADATVHVYPGSGHLIADNSLPGFEPDSAALILARTTQFLDRMG